MQDESVISMDKCAVNHLLVIFGTKCNRSKRLGFTACKQRRTVSCGQVIHFAPYRPYGTYITAIQADTLIQNQVPNGFVLYIMVIFFDQKRCLLIYFLLTKCLFYKRLSNLLKLFAPLVLSRCRLRNGVHLIIR